MERLKRERATSRSLFTKAKNDLLIHLDMEDADKETLIAAFKCFEVRAEQLFTVDERFKEQWLDQEDFDEGEFTKDQESGDPYRFEWEKLKVRYDRSFRKSSHQRDDSSLSDSSDATIRKSKTGRDKKGSASSCASCTSNKRHFRLPKIEFRKFDGNIKNWIGFWGQFKKIDADETMDEEDKFQYLYQSTVPGSPARELIDSFPPSGENYKKAIEQMKSRFAREDMLIDTYVRELLNLVLAQAKQNNLHSLSQLYDRLKTQLQALESLGVTSEKYASMLFPLVESALPEDTLRAWERSRLSQYDKANDLNKLLEFLKHEVESDERIQVARNSLTSDGDQSDSAQSKLPTAACLASSTESKEAKKSMSMACIWCDKTSHNSLECYKGNKMSYEARRDLLTKKSACLICLRTGHNMKKCRSYTKCIFCSKRHSMLMCPETQRSKTSRNDRDDNLDNDGGHNTSRVNMSQKINSTTLLPTLMVKVSNGDNYINVRAFIDTGAQKSYISSDVIQKLSLKPIDQEVLGHTLFGGVKIKRNIYKVYEFTVKALNEDYQLKMTALEKNMICGQIPRINNSTQLLSQLQRYGVTLSDCGQGTPDIGLLIGADFSGALCTNHHVELQNNAVAIKTKLGWTIQGQVVNVCSTISTVTLANLLIADMWEMETIGIRDPAETLTVKEANTGVMNDFRNSITINEDKRYEVELPRKPLEVELLNNRQLAEKRLLSTTKKLLKMNEFEAYNNVFQEWLDQGIIEVVSDDDQSGHFLPHHAVIKESSQTTRVRPVFDASARDFNGNSLNSLLDKGVNYLELIPKLLIKFRKYAIVSDVKKAFLQISLKPEDRNYLKFLWWKDDNRKELIVYQHCRVVFGLTSSPFLLAATIMYHLEKYTDEYHESAERLNNSFYVDNCVTSIDSEDDTKKFIEEAKKVMMDGKFDLRDWVTAPMKYKEMSGKEVNLSVLGMIWNIERDTLGCNTNFINDISKSDKVTRRELLSITQKLFDPIGIICPTTLIPKLIIQKTWQPKNSAVHTVDSEYKWDEELPDELCDEFKIWLKHIHLLRDCCIPRRMTSKPIDSCENTLHVFCDASKTSYAACIFLRSEKDCDVFVQLLLAKSRVAPSRKEITIPRLELLSALIATRLYMQAKEALEISDCKTYFWTDSSVVLTWITTNGDWKVFVKNRVREIRQNTNPNDWRHVPGSMNPADLPSRGCNARILRESRWWEGPRWLKEKPNEWPNSEEKVNQTEVDQEKGKAIVVNSNLDINDLSSAFGYFSKYSKIVRMMGWMLRFINNCRMNTRRSKGELSCEEYQAAEKTLLKLIQEESTFDHRKKNINLFKDKEGLVRLRTKLLLSDEVANFTSPIFLQGKHPILKKLVEERHRQLRHAGSGTLIAHLREHYWITGVRKMVKTVTLECVTCKRQNVKHLQTPLPPLPRDRVQPAAVFQITGVDLAGPLFLRSGEKVWIVLFTCAVYRAIHLELTKSLSTEAFLMTLRRFISRRGRVETIYSDNGTNFHGADNKFEALDWKEITSFSNARRITWKFNVPAASWWGGWFERLVRSVKELLRRNLGKSTVTYDELETLLCDCEGIINSRPLTYITDDTECLKPLTPACFLLGLPRSDVPDLDKIDNESLNKRLRFLCTLRQNLRTRFRSEYLSMLIQRGKETRIHDLDVGDVVLIETQDKRINWPLGLVTETYVGRDGHARVAKLKTANGEIKRPFQRLYPLEIINERKTNCEVGAPQSNKGNSKTEGTIPAKGTIPIPCTTRSGRMVKIPKFMDL